MEETNYSKKKQITLIIICALVYAISYLGRFSYNANINLFISEYNISKSEAGLVTSFFFFGYGIGQFINAFICKYYNKRIVIFSVLIISSIINFLVFIGIPFQVIKFLWLINGLNLSILWPTLILTLSENLDKKFLKPAILVMSSTIPIGILIIYGLSALFASINSFTTTFIISTIFLIITSFIWFILYKISVRDKKLDASTFKEEMSSNDENSYRSSLKYIILLMVSLSLIAILDNLFKDGIQTWIPTIIKESYGVDDSISILLSLTLPLFAFFGAYLAVLLNKKIKDYIYLCSIFFIVISGLLLLSTYLFDLPSYAFSIISFMIIELLLYAVNNVITSMAPLLLRRRINSGFLAGFLNGMCNIGSMISSYGIGALADNYGEWKNVFMILFLISLLSIIIGIIYFIIKNIIIHKEKNSGQN